MPPVKQMKILNTLLVLVSIGGLVIAAPSTKQLEDWFKRFPAADTNGDGRLTAEEADTFRKLLTEKKSQGAGSKQGAAPRNFKVDPGWDADRFPEHAASYQSAEQIRALYEKSLKGKKAPLVVSFEKPTDGGLRIVGTGHSFMRPGYSTFPRICEAAGFKQALYTHTGGGITGSTRYKWEQENGIFQFDGKPQPKLLASIANAEWDAMMWGPYFHDRPTYYSCWMDFCLKYHPHMKFYLSDAWPQLYQLGEIPKTEAVLTAEVFDRMGAEKRAIYSKLVNTLRKSHGEKVFIMPTSDAMLLAVKHYLRGELPGVEGINRIIGGKQRSLWRDQLGHLGPGFDRLEGYVFYATIYRRSPGLIKKNIQLESKQNYPSAELDKIFRKIAWQAVIEHPLSGVRDENADGIGD